VRRWAVLLLPLALVVACGGGEGSSEPAEPAAAIDFSGEAPTVDGGRVDLGDYADRDLVVWFWAPW
jgi:hypothetical protein